MNHLRKTQPFHNDLYKRVSALLHEARNKAMQSVNSVMVQAYWHVGREIVEAEQKGKLRADYGKQLLKNLSHRLTSDFGQGFDQTNLRKIRQFYLSYPILDALRLELSWTHYRILMRIENKEARFFYEIDPFLLIALHYWHRGYS